eukprot:g8854.t1
MEMRLVPSPENDYTNIIAISGHAPEDPLNKNSGDLAKISSMQENSKSVEEGSPYKIVTATNRKGEHHTYTKMRKYENDETTIYVHDHINNKKILRQGTNGYRATTTVSKGKPVMQGDEDVFMTALTLQFQSRYPSSHGIYFSDGKTIQKRGPLLEPFEDASRENPATLLVSGIAKFYISGVNLGFNREDIIEIRIFGHMCTTIRHYNNSYLTCTTGLKEILRNKNVSPEDVYIMTSSGGSSESNAILNFQARQTEGYRVNLIYLK